MALSAAPSTGLPSMDSARARARSRSNACKSSHSARSVCASDRRASGTRKPCRSVATTNSRSLPISWANRPALGSSRKFTSSTDSAVRGVVISAERAAEASCRVLTSALPAAASAAMPAIEANGTCCSGAVHSARLIGAPIRATESSTAAARCDLPTPAAPTTTTRSMSLLRWASTTAARSLSRPTRTPELIRPCRMRRPNQTRGPLRRQRPAPRQGTHSSRQ